MCVPFCAQPLETVGQCSAGDIRDMNTLDILITNRILGQWDSKGDIGDRLTWDILITKRVELYKVGDGGQSQRYQPLPILIFLCS